MKVKVVGVMLHRYLRTTLQHTIDELHRDLFIYMYEINNYTFRGLPSARTKTTIIDYHAKVVLTNQISYNMAAMSNWWALNLGGYTNKWLTVLPRTTFFYLKSGRLHAILFCSWPFCSSQFYFPYVLVNLKNNATIRVLLPQTID